MPSARVAVVYRSTGLRRETQSSSAGVFHIGGLPIGECYLEVGAEGFRTVQTKPLFLAVGETRSVDVSLEVASVDSNIEVVSVADPLATTLIAVSAPNETERFRKSEMSQQWTAQIQQRLALEMSAQVSYIGIESSHVFAQTPDNVVNPITGKRTLPALDQVNDNCQLPWPNGRVAARGCSSA